MGIERYETPEATITYERVSNGNGINHMFNIKRKFTYIGKCKVYADDNGNFALNEEYKNSLPNIYTLI